MLTNADVRRLILLTLREVLSESPHTLHAPDDPSGLCTVFLVDQEQALKKIEQALKDA